MSAVPELSDSESRGSIQRSPTSARLVSGLCIDGSAIPRFGKAGVEDVLEGGCVEIHRGEEGLVILTCVEVGLWCAHTRIRQEIWACEIKSNDFGGVHSGSREIQAAKNKRGVEGNRCIVFHVLLVTGSQICLKGVHAGRDESNQRPQRPASELRWIDTVLFERG